MCACVHVCVHVCAHVGGAGGVCVHELGMETEEEQAGRNLEYGIRLSKTFSGRTLGR